MAEGQRPGSGDGPGRVRLARLAAQGHISRVTSLTDYTSYADAQRHFAPARLWELFDGDRERLNIAHECIDRHAADPHRDRHSHRPCRRPRRGDQLPQHRRAVVALRPLAGGAGHRAGRPRRDHAGAVAARSTRPLFGTMKRGAIAVPLFTLFGPDGVRLRVDDCTPRLLLTTPDKAQSLGELPAAGDRRRTTRSPRRLSRYPSQLRARHARPTIWRSSSTRRARRANCPPRSSTPIAPSSR